MSPILKILIVEDQSVVGCALREECLDSGHDVIGVATSVGEAIDLLCRSVPDVAIVDLHLGQDRSDVLAAALARSGVRVIVVSGETAPSTTLAHVPHVFMSKPADCRLVASIAGKAVPYSGLHHTVLH